MDWWGNMGYMLVYKIFEKMYLVLGWTSNHMGKLTFSKLFWNYLDRNSKYIFDIVTVWWEKLIYRRASCIKKGSQS